MAAFSNFRHGRLTRSDRNPTSGKRRFGGRASLGRGLATLTVLGATALTFGVLGSTPAAPDTNGTAATAPTGNSGDTGNTGASTGAATTTTTTTSDTTTTTAPTTTTTTTTAVAATSGVIAGASQASGDDSPKITICHSTDSAKNPWVSETVDENSILQGGHGNSGINADDIIPPFTDGADGSYPGNNYSVDAVWSGHGANTSFTATETGETILANDCNYYRISTTTSTTVFDGTTNEPWSGTETVGATAYDTSTVGPQLVAGPVATAERPPITGTVTYTFFMNGSCDGDGVAQTVDIVDGAPDPSSHTLSLAAGSYSYLASYSGDSTYDSSVGECEPFSVGTVPSTASTVLNDAATNAPWTGDETTGAQAYDTSTVSGGIEGFTPTGTVTYTLFDNGTCTSPAQGDSRAHAIISTQTVTLNWDGSVPNSATTSPLTPGDYSFDASYSGDTNYDPSGASECEPFSVSDGATSTATILKDATTGQNWAGTETAGAIAFDTSTVSGEAGGIVPTGTVTYSYFTNGTCNGTPASTEDVTLNPDGSVPNSKTTSSLAAGSYSFDAVYTGDDNYAASAVSSCEPFTVAAVTSGSTATPNTPATSAGTTATPAATKGAAIAFTGADLAGMWAGAIALLGLGGLLVLTSRRRKGHAAAE
ncbi:MAG TPA: hypothetical protein VHZ05_14575 [Acidimicrobiales bacterium]|nr:hypothetical protein [Acidimicrobiales bacterium]